MCRLNPGYKALTIFLISLILSFEYNYYINFTIFILAIILMLLSKVKLKKDFNLLFTSCDYGFGSIFYWIFLWKWRNRK